jgi:hypothetical protein
MARPSVVLGYALFYAGLAAMVAGGVLLSSRRGLGLGLLAAGLAAVVASTFVRPSRPAT